MINLSTAVKIAKEFSKLDILLCTEYDDCYHFSFRNNASDQVSCADIAISKNDGKIFALSLLEILKRDSSNKGLDVTSKVREITAA